MSLNTKKIAIVLGITSFVGMQAAFAAGVNKTDPMIKQAIKETAEPVKMIDQDPVPSVELVEEPAEEPIMVITSGDIEKVQIEEEVNEAGFRAGNLLIQPSATLSQGYDDNIYATDANEEDDTFTQIAPSLRIELMDQETVAALDLDYSYKTYWDHSDEDRHDAKASLGGDLALGRGWSVPFGVLWEQTHEDREEDLTAQIPDEPLKIKNTYAKTGLKFKPSTFGISVVGEYLSQKFDDAIGLVSNLPIIRSDADRDIYNGTLGLEYDISEETQFVLAGSYGGRDYDSLNYQAGGFNGPDRSSDTWGGVTGLRFKAKKLQAEFMIGYKGFDYDLNAIADIEALVGNVDLAFHATDNLTFSLGYDRDIYEDDEIIQPITFHKADAGIAYKFAPAWLARVGGGLDYRDFESLSRNDETYHVGAGLEYMLHDNWSLVADYLFSTRDSDAAGLDYDRSRALLSLTGKL